MADDSDMADVASSTGNGLAGVPFMYNDPVLREFEGSITHNVHQFVNGHPNFDVAIKGLAILRKYMSAMVRYCEIAKDVAEGEILPNIDIELLSNDGSSEDNDEETERAGSPETASAVSTATELFESDFDFDSVLPGAVLQHEYRRPYDALWLSNLGVPYHKFQDFDAEWTSRFHMQDLFRVGALARGDLFGVEIINMAGQPEWKYAQCSTPDKIISAVVTHFRGKCAIGHGYGGVTVWRGTHQLGTITKIRQVYAMWRMTVDKWTEDNGAQWRERKENKKTGRFAVNPAITRRMKYLNTA
ncbi:MAG: hypothetical protein L6R39_003085 [Caloplaca ligustica]|nr:MAG: hypothetical protein L6R39_003085 [Caloplaca ligustica]